MKLMKNSRRVRQGWPHGYTNVSVQTIPTSVPQKTHSPLLAERKRKGRLGSYLQFLPKHPRPEPHGHVGTMMPGLDHVSAADTSVPRKPPVFNGAGRHTGRNHRILSTDEDVNIESMICLVNARVRWFSIDEDVNIESMICLINARVRWFRGGEPECLTAMAHRRAELVRPSPSVPTRGLRCLGRGEERWEECMTFGTLHASCLACCDAGTAPHTPPRL